MLRATRLRHWLWLLLPLLASAWARGLWAPDEPRYAEVARELHATGDFLVLHLCGEVYPDKPPLLYWLAGLLGWLSGWSVFAMRLVSVASMAGTAALVGVLARRWWGTPEGRYAPALFLGTAMIAEIGGRLQIDPLLTLLCTWALIEVDACARTEERALAHALRAGLATGLAALAKGPVAFLVIGLVALAWRLLPRRARTARRSWRELALALLLAFLPVFAWAILACLREPALWRPLFFGQHMGRALEGTQHTGPPWKYLLFLPVLLMPWTIPVVFGVLAAVRSFRERAQEAARDEGLWRAAAWFLVLLVFFSALPPKRDLYLLPAYPAAALLSARWLALAVRDARLPAWVGWFPAGIFAVVGALLLFADPIAKLVVANMAGEEPLGGLDPAAIGWRSLPAGLSFLVGAFASVRALRRRAIEGWAWAIWLSWAAGLTATALLLFPLADALKSPRPLGEWLAGRPEKPSAIPCLGVQPEGYRFYGGAPTVRDDDLAAALDREGERFLGLARDRDFERLPLELRERMRVLHRASVGSREILVLGAAPRPP